MAKPAKALDKAFGLPGTFQRLYIAVRGSAFPAAFGEFAFYEAEAVTKQADLGDARTVVEFSAGAWSEFTATLK